MQESDFSNAKINDRAFHIRYGRGTISKIDSNVGIWFSSDIPGYACWIMFDGRVEKTDALPSLYHDEIKFEIPPLPKRMVKKTIKFWARIDVVCKDQISSITIYEHIAKEWIYRGFRVEEFAKEIEVEE